MKQYMDQNFLLSTETARTLFHDFASSMPIVDYHCHVSPKEIAEDLQYDNIAQAWLSGDHYKWRLIRSNGINEDEITEKNTSDRAKFMRLAEVMPKSIGNPLYHWTHLELQRYFGCDTPLSPDTAEKIWEHCNAVLQNGLGVRKMIRNSNVRTICTTDDPVDSLEWHKKIREGDTFSVDVFPAFRPDKAINLEVKDFPLYIERLSTAASIKISDLEGLLSALKDRIDFFHEMGCRASDHALEYCFCRRDTSIAAAAFRKALKGELLTREEIESYKTEVLLFLAGCYARRGWVMQIHYGAIRNVNSKMMKRLGPDTGFDSMSTRDSSKGLMQLLDAIADESGLPKTILYSLNPADNAMIVSAIGCFQDDEIAGKIQHGAAWWFNDTKRGMADQIETLAAGGVLGNFVGMLTDSRSFLSYTRHEYFRRILCDTIGRWVENGEYPNDIDFLGRMVEDISYNNAVNYFGFSR